MSEKQRGRPARPITEIYADPAIWKLILFLYRYGGGALRSDVRIHLKGEKNPHAVINKAIRRGIADYDGTYLSLTKDTTNFFKAQAEVAEVGESELDLDL